MIEDHFTDEALDGQDVQKRLVAAERRLNRARELESELRAEREQVRRLEKELGILANVYKNDKPSKPAWAAAPPKAGRKHHGTPWLMLSDLHLDEVIEPAQIMGINAYNRKIALQRLERTTEGFIKVTRDYWTGIVYDGVVVAFGGDIFSGDIHEELKETNEDTILGSLDYWIGALATAVERIADEFGNVHIPVVVGNHGRMTRKPRAKFRARSNFDWFLGKALERMFAGDKRITFDVSESADVLIPAYGQTVMMTHGDQASGGGGIGGIWPPLMRLDARKRARNAAFNIPYDLLIMGHWHQLVFGPQFIVNGSLKGADEYAWVSNFAPEPPQQACWLMTPEHGKTWTAPILSQDRRKEGW